MNIDRAFLLIAISLCLISPQPGSPQIAIGGDYTLEKAVIAGGGKKAAGGVFEIDNTVGQPAVSTKSLSASYTLESGFWTRQQFAPTSAHVSVSGRVVRDSNRGIGSARVTLYGGNLTNPLQALTSNFGYFRFEGVEVGHLYVLTVSSKGFTFQPNTYALQLWDDTADIVFQAIENN